ncbi:MAG: hypothetical protein QF570_15200 [Myxococcota bacterium]|jgi:glutathione S-transferase|nr:hypothetical protein [Myxococcota bacterium]
MSAFVSVAQAREMDGVRLVLTANAPGPWGEAAKGMLHVKGIPFTRVLQEGGGENADLVAWTSVRNAPQIVDESGNSVSAWRDLIAWAEAHEPQPRLVPEDPSERELMFDLTESLAGEGGFGWCRRLLLFKPIMDLAKQGDEPNPAFAAVTRMADAYHYSDEAAGRASKDCAAILNRIAERLRAQRERRARYLVGAELSALDIHWAAFAAMVSPLPDELCPMPDYLRESYGKLDETVAAAANAAPELLEHRDFIYREHLELPVVIN